MQINSVEDVWGAIREECRKQMVDVSFNLWIKDLELVEIKAKEIVLASPEKWKIQLIYDNYMDILRDSAKNIMGIDTDITITEKAKPEMPSVEIAGDFTTQYTFDNYIVGACNRFAHAAAMQVAENPSLSYNPLVIWGNSGVGKTHLLLAIKNRIHEKYPNLKIEYLRGEDFLNQFIKSVSEGKLGFGTIDDFREKYRGADILLMDDIHFIAGKESTQEEFFNTFNALISKNKQIVVTMDRAPKDVKSLDERIRSRLEQGLFADITPPEFETRVSIINSKANMLGIEIEPQNAYYIAENIKMSTRQLEGVVKKIKMYIEIEGSNKVPLSVVQNFVRDVVNDTTPEPIKIEKIIAEVARTYGVEESDILSKRKTAELALARQVAMYIARETTELSYKLIGEAFNKDHTTVLHNTRKIETYMRENPYEKGIIEDIIKNLKSE